MIIINVGLNSCYNKINNIKYNILTYIGLQPYTIPIHHVHVMRLNKDTLKYERRITG